MDDLLRVGVITSPHGVAGEVNVFPTTDEPERFRKWKELILKDKKGQKTVHVTGVKQIKQMMILRLEECESRSEAELLRQSELYITRDQSAPCKANENFVVDLIGLKVVTDEGEALGTCTDVLETGANDVYEVTMEGGKKVLLPAIPPCILNVDLEKQEMLVHVLDGLLDL